MIALVTQHLQRPGKPRPSTVQAIPGRLRDLWGASRGLRGSQGGSVS